MTDEQIVSRWCSLSIQEEYPNIWLRDEERIICELFTRTADETHQEMIAAGYVATPDDGLYFLPNGGC